MRALQITLVHAGFGMGILSVYVGWGLVPAMLATSAYLVMAGAAVKSNIDSKKERDYEGR